MREKYKIGVIIANQFDQGRCYEMSSTLWTLLLCLGGLLNIFLLSCLYISLYVAEWADEKKTDRTSSSIVQIEPTRGVIQRSSTKSDPEEVYTI